jgi:signal transduction histidine kinase
MSDVLAPTKRLTAQVLGFSLVVMAIAAALGIVTARGISGQLRRLAEAASRIGNGDFDTPIEAPAGSEIGALADSLRVMAANLKATTASMDRLNAEIEERRKAEATLAVARQKLIETAHNAGKAELASTVLHNVANALNSISVLAGTVRSRLSRLKLDNLKRVAGMFEQHRDNLANFVTTDEKGSKLSTYLAYLSTELEDEQRYMLGKIDALAEQVHRIAEMISVQQSHTKPYGLIELVAVSDLIENAVELNIASIEQHGIQLVRRYAPLPPIEVDCSAVIQILVNLISNAVYAVLASDKEKKVITLSARAMTDEFIQIEVTDNGVGIAPENATRIFEYGFTTKKRGHGFGLHGSAIAAKAMGGKVVAYSRGAGQGATFILELPVKARMPDEVQV